MKSNGIKYLSFILFVLPLFAQENPCIQGPTFNIDKCREFVAKAKAGYAKKSALDKEVKFLRDLGGGTFDKADWLLTNPENIKKLDKEKYELIKSELDKMTKNYKNKIDRNGFAASYYQKKSIQTYTTGYMTNRQKDAYASAILGIKNPNQYQAEVLKNQYTSYKTTEKEIISNRRITIDKDLKTEQPEWADIVKYVGGHSELPELGITKDDMPKFKIQKKLESIELTGKNTCLAHVIIEGDEKYGLKYYGIQKKNYTYNGSYEIISDNIDFSTIYGMAESTPNINITFKFAKHKHLPPIDMVVPLSSIGEEWGSKAIPYRDIMVQMINDMISDEEFVKIYSKEL